MSLTSLTFTKDMEDAAVNAPHNEINVGGESVNRLGIFSIRKKVGSRTT